MIDVLNFTKYLNLVQVKVMKGEMATSSVHVPPGAVRAAKSNAKVSPANIERHVSTSAAPRAQVHSSNSAPSGDNAPSSNSTPTNNGAPRSNISPESGQDHPEGFIHLFCVCTSIFVVFSDVIPLFLSSAELVPSNFFYPTRHSWWPFHIHRESAFECNCSTS